MASLIPEIPHDKSYHVFVCYEKNSLDVVRIIVDNLEKDGIMCCYYDRDFTPGRSIIENMYEAIGKSMNMLVVLSEEFENSPYCVDEMDKAFNLRVRGEYNLIPIKIEPCSVPECLRHLVYIDVEDSIDTAHVKIKDAISKKEKNGEYVQFEVHKYKLCMPSFTRYRLKFTETERAVIWNNQFEVSAELLQEIEDTVNGSFFVKYLHIFNHPYSVIFIIFLHLLILQMIVFLVLLLTTGREKADSFQPVQYCLAVGLPTWLLLLCMSMLFYCIKDNRRFNVFLKTYSVLQTKLWNISKQNITQTGVLFFLNVSNILYEYPNIRFNIMYYNLKPCEVYFARQLEKRESLKKFRMENETNEECTSRLFNEYLSQSCAELVDTSTTRRHKMKNNAKCVCLLVEGWLKQSN
ncbi:uncharacterized protein LOC123564654 isoform X2 [Mercenaria mercenaria]|uniref:uncharacterized protein LOC123564654 isoform X2 n=1 Tax=Mercenaria mercenaria TaxID=6596 RepID=UPI00234FAA6C|nr:uncharacterized protein LOC123564654 isoform X2 [Mercenaria mercenaria]